MSLSAAKGINVDAAEEAEQQGRAPKAFFWWTCFYFTPNWLQENLVTHHGALQLAMRE